MRESTNTDTTYRERFYSRYLSLYRRTELKDVEPDLRIRSPYVEMLIRKHFPQERSSNVLDLGCGYGALLLGLRSAGYNNLTGVETSAEQVAFAHGLGLTSVIQGDLIDVLRKQTKESHDIVVAFDVLEHFSKSEILTITDEAFRVLRANGTFLIHVPNAEGIFSARVRFADFTHENAFTRDSIRQFILSAGFRSINFMEDVPIVHGIKSGVRYLLWKFFRGVFRLIYAAETGDFDEGLVLSQNILGIARK